MSPPYPICVPIVRSSASEEQNPGAVHIDAAHGVGAPKMEALAKVLGEEMPEGGLEVEVRNRVGEGPLNEGCGAEWAQKVWWMI